MDKRLDSYPEGYSSPMMDLAQIGGITFAVFVVIVIIVKFFIVRDRRIKMIYEAAERQQLHPIKVKGIWPIAYATKNSFTKLVLLGDHLHVVSLRAQKDASLTESFASPRNI